MKNRLIWVVLVMLAVSAACAMRQAGAPIRPGFNVYTKDQDIQLGREAAAQVVQELDVVQNSELQNYVKSLGQKLAATPSAGDYPYEFTLVNDPSINAFALPGGPIFVHSGLIRAAANEAQVAGVLGHEIAHVVLRHGTNQASKAGLLELPAAAAGVLLGGSAAGQIAQIGTGLGLNLLLLKYSRGAETQADAQGAKILYEAGYDPVEMARFFETLEKESGNGGPEFLESHPNPGNRVAAVQAEARTFAPKQYTAGTGDFASTKQLVAGLPAPRKRVEDAISAAAPRQAQTGGGSQTLQTQRFRMEVPSNWVAYGDQGGNSVVAGPQNGLFSDGRGQVQVGYGVLIGQFQPKQSGNIEGNARELVNYVRANDPGLQVGNLRRTQVNGTTAFMADMRGSSPFGGSESNLLVTVPQANGMMFLVFAAPERDWPGLQNAATAMLNTLQLGR